MKAAVFEKSGQMVLADVEKPQLKNDDDVLIRVIRTCVCGSDLWAYKEGDHKKKLIQSMMVMKLWALLKR